MSATATQISAVTALNGPRRTAKTGVSDAASPQSWIGNLWTTFKTGELRVQFMTAHKPDENAAYAQRWPAPAIAALIASTGLGLLSVVSAIVMGLFLFYANSTKADGQQRLQDANQRTEDVRVLTETKAKADQALRENEELSRRLSIAENDLKVVRMAQKLQ